jgi:hypothetical protein
MLYRGICLSPQESAMCWGFECGDGWYSLIRELSEQLTTYLQQRPELDLEITQVKSKFGILRIHSRGGDTTTRHMITHACEQASMIPEHP